MLVKLLGCFSHPIADIFHRFDQVTGFSQLLSKRLDVDIYRSGLFVVVSTPDLIMQRLSAEHLTRMLHEQFQQFKLLVGKLKHLTLYRYTPFR